MQVICYAGVKLYTTKETSSMGYALLYAGLNFGAMLTGPLSSKVRTTQDIAYKAGESKLSGFNAMNWVCFGITVVTLLVFALLLVVPYLIALPAAQLYYLLRAGASTGPSRAA